MESLKTKRRGSLIKEENNAVEIGSDKLA